MTNLTLNDLFPSLSGRTIYEKYPASGLVHGFALTTFNNMYWLKKSV